jgi:hypothetical protein
MIEGREGKVDQLLRVLVPHRAERGFVTRQLRTR